MFIEKPLSSACLCTPGIHLKVVSHVCFETWYPRAVNRAFCWENQTFKESLGCYLTDAGKNLPENSFSWRVSLTWNAIYPPFIHPLKVCAVKYNEMGYWCRLLPTSSVNAVHWGVTKPVEGVTLGSMKYVIHSVVARKFGLWKGFFRDGQSVSSRLCAVVLLCRVITCPAVE